MLFAKLPDYPKYRIYLDGRVYGEKRGKFLKWFLTNSGYYVVGLRRDGKEKQFRLHRLLAMCFLPCNKNFSDVSVDHININKTDNRIENLRWLDHSGQMLNRKYKETNTGYPFINKNNHRGGFRFNCQIWRNGKFVLAINRVKLEDAVAVVRQFILDNIYIFDGYSRETIDKIKERYKL